jgi:hypothetical protein
MNIFKFFLYLLYVISFGLIVYGFIYAFDFYNLEFIERPHHGLYNQLKPGGFLGHGYGIVGTAMMLLLLLYSMRKRTRVFGKMGAVSRWLDVHIYFGIIGPLLIVLHTSFKLNGIVAISFWSMVAVALSGVIGRYLYLQIPRGIRGNELNMQELEDMDNKLSFKILNSYEIEPDALEKLQTKILGNINPNRNAVSLLLSLLFSDLFRFIKNSRIKKEIRKSIGLPTSQVKELIAITKKKALIHRRVLLLDKVHKLFHYWHVIHKPFALIMYLIMIVHVGITVVLGYTWIF